MTDWVSLNLQRQGKLPTRQQQPQSRPQSQPQPTPAQSPAQSTAQQTTDWVRHVQAVTQAAGKPMGQVEEETTRILSLPVLPENVLRCPDPVAYNQSFLLNPPLHPEFSLRPVQIDGIWTYETYGGLFGPCSVGSGKSLIVMGSAIRAISRRGHYRVVIIVPSPVYHQFTRDDIPWARERINFDGVAVHFCEGTAGERLEIAKRPGSGIWVYKYSSLSTQTGYVELKAIRATAYFLDEAHSVARATTARTKRFYTILKELEKEKVIETTHALTGSTQVQAIEVAAVSGTLTKKSINDYAHLATRALGLLSPAPIHGMSQQIYSSAIDSESDGQSISDLDSNVLKQFFVWAKENNYDYTKPTKKKDESDQEYQRRCEQGLTEQEQLRLAYMHRLRTSPGVIATEEQGVDSSLIIHWDEAPKPDTVDMQKIVQLMQQVSAEGITPSGDTIDYAMHQFKWLWELSSGFYNNLLWPTIEKVKEDYLRNYQKQITDIQAEALLSQAMHHHKLLQEYHKILRQFLNNTHLPGCDTPMLVAQEIINQREKKQTKHNLPGNLIEAYWTQREEGPQTYPDLPQRFSVPVRVCDYKLRTGLAWVNAIIKKHKAPEGLMWYHHPEIGRWFCELLKEADIPHTYAPAGEDALAKSSGLVVLSYSHGVGKNLQHQRYNYFLEVRREAHAMEQTLGRTHRSGQKADTVEAWLSLANGFDLALYTAALRDADYAQTTLGQEWRLCYADYDPPIPICSPRLAIKLGIIKQHAGAVEYHGWEPITPPSLQEVADLFRPMAYGK